MKSSKWVKCRYCDWKTVRWYTNDKGERKNTGLSRLDYHMGMKHPEEYSKYEEYQHELMDMEEEYVRLSNER